MSKEIEQRVLEMQFDNKQFEQGVSTTMASLSKLKQSLNLTGAAKGLESVGTAVRGINLAPLSSAAETVAVKFSYMQMAIQHQLNNLVDSAFRAGKRIIAAFTIDPTKTGFSEYETQINAVQTILANTKNKGTTINDVNRALDELNLYADKTIYNFTEMTRNIGRFTAAGVDLDKSVSSIKGIANLAAVSGANSQQASNAMYQLSQALASGRVNLMDWNSVVNAGMGGEVFQNALKRTATNMGTNVDELIEKYGSFRESLSRGEWLTADVLSETLTQLSGAYTEADLLAQGYTKQQAKDILDLAATAESAATDVKTLTQLWDTLKESAQSGWAQTWEIVVGDFDEAKSVFSSVSKALGDIIGNSAQSRNEFLQGWKDAGGRDDLIAGFKNAFEGLGNIIKPIKEAFREIFPPVTVERIVQLTRGFRELTEKFIFWPQALLNVKGQMEAFGRTEAEIIEHNAKLKNTIDNIVKVFKGLFAAVNIGWNFVKSLAGGVVDLARNFSGLGSAALEVTARIGEWLINLNNASEEYNVFGKVVDTVTGFIGKAIDGIKTFAGFLKNNFVTAGLDSVLAILTGISDVIRSVFGGLSEMASGLGDAFGNAFRSGDMKNVIDIVNAGIFTAILKGVKDFTSGMSDSLETVTKSVTGLLDVFKDIGEIPKNINSILGAVKDTIVTYQNEIKANTIFRIASAIAILAGAVTVISLIDSDKLEDSLGAISVLFVDLLGSLAVFGKLPTAVKGVAKSIGAMTGIAIAVGILAVALKAVSEVDGDKLLGSVIGVAALSAIMIGVAKALSASGKIIIKGASQMILFAVATGVLAEVCKRLSTLNVGQLTKGLVGVGVLLGEIALFLNYAKFSRKATATAVGIVVLSGAIKILATACEDFGNMNSDVLTKGLVGIGVLLAELAAFTKLTANARKVISTATAMILIGAAMKIFASAVSELGSMDSNVITQGLIGMAGALAILTVALNKMPKHVAGTGIGLVIVAGALIVLTKALSQVGGMSLEQVGIGLAALGGSMLILAKGLKGMNGTLAGAASLTVAALALSVLVDSLTGLGGMSLAQVGIGLGALAGSMLILGIALKAMVGTMSGSAALLVAAGALAIVATSVQTLGSLNLASVGIALLALVGVFAVFGVAGLVLAPLVPVLQGLGAAILLFGAGCMAAGAGIAAFGAGLVMVAEGGSEAVDLIITAIKGAADLIPHVIGKIGEGLVNLAKIISDGAPALGDALVALIKMAVDVLKTSAPNIAEGIFQFTIRALEIFTQYAPKVVEFLANFLVSMIDSLAAHIPELVVSAMNLIGAFFQGIVDALSGIDIATFTQAVVGVGLLAGLMWALGAIASAIPGAMVGVLGMGVVIAELALVLAAIGALAQIPGLSWLIGEGGNLLQQIGTAIGQFVGGIVGGIAEGATSTLPQVGTNLSTFMTNLQPFIDGVSGIDSAIIDNTSTLAKAILALTAADLISGIASFFKGGTSLADFGTEIVYFGTAMKNYAAEVAGIDTTSISASVTAAQDIVKMAGEIPSDGLFGTDGIDDFGRNIVTFGKKMRQYGDEVAGIDAESISASVKAAKGLVQVAKQIPDDGTFGTDGIDDFGKNIATFGKKLRKYSEEIAGIDTDTSSKVVAMVHSLVGVINSLAGLDASGIDPFTAALKDFSKIDLSGFASSFSDSVTGIIQESLTNISEMGDKFNAAGAETISKYIAGIQTGKTQVFAATMLLLTTVLSTIRNHYSLFNAAGAYLVVGFAAGISANRYLAAAQARAMAAAAASAARKELDEHSPSRVGYGIGDFFGIGFVNAIADNVKNAYSASANMAHAAESGLKGAFDKVIGIINGDIDIQPTITPVLDLTNVRNGANAINGMFGLTPSVGVLSNLSAVSSMMNQRGQNGGNDDVVAAIKNLGTKLGGSHGDIYNINGVDISGDADVAEAFKVIVRAIQVRRRR